MVRERLLYFEELITGSESTYILAPVTFGSEGFFSETFLYVGPFWPYLCQKMTINWEFRENYKKVSEKNPSDPKARTANTYVVLLLLISS